MINKKIEAYADRMSTPVDIVLDELEKETYQKELRPNMLSGSYQGQLLSIISQLKKPRNILEIGTYTGYSTICLAQGLAVGGKLFTIEKDEELRTIQDKYFKKCQLEGSIVQHFGDAKHVIPDLAETFDLVFIDADKKNYKNYLEMVYPIMESGAMLLSDNVLWKGKVTFDEGRDKIGEKIHEYNKHLLAHQCFSTVLLPIRDGLSVSIKNKKNTTR